MAVRFCAVTAEKGQPTASTAATRPEANRIMLTPGHVKVEPRGDDRPRGCAQYISGFSGGRTYSLGFLTSTLGKVTSFFSVPTLGTVIVSLTVPVSMDGVFTVSVSVPTTGFWTSYCPSPVFLHPLSVQSAANIRASVRFRTNDLRLRDLLDPPITHANMGGLGGNACVARHPKGSAVPFRKDGCR